jgi:hypothetical protein
VSQDAVEFAVGFVPVDPVGDSFDEFSALVVAGVDDAEDACLFGGAVAVPSGFGVGLGLGPVGFAVGPSPSVPSGQAGRVGDPSGLVPAGFCFCQVAGGDAGRVSA